jgi:hypothetical protein
MTLQTLRVFPRRPLARAVAFFAMAVLSFTTCKLDRLLGPVTPPTIEATLLDFDVQPGNVTANQNFVPVVRVRVTDGGGNLATEATTPVTVSLIGGTTGAVLNGTKTVTPSLGLVTFNTIQVDRAGTGYRLVVTGTGLTPDTSVTFNVAGAPTIVLTPTSRTFTAPIGGANPAAQTVAVTNGGSGTLSNLAIGTITYGSGQPTGWLAASLNAQTAPATVTLTPTTGTLPAGTYTATVPVTSTVAGVTNSPQNITVTFTVTQAPTISLNVTTRTYAATAGGANPAAQTVSITNTGTGTLSGLAVGTIAYGAGASGWITTSFNTTTAPATLTINANVGVLTAGTYTATVPVTSSALGVTNSPQNISVTFNVAQPTGPAIGLDPSSRQFTATVGGASPAAQTVAVTNVGINTLSGLAIGTIVYGSGQPTGWLAASLSGTTAPATVTLNATTGSLAAGTYTATVPVTSTAAGVTNSPQNISVTFTVSASSNPTIGLTPSSRTFTATAGGASPATQTVSVTNVGGGTLNNLAVGTITYGSGQTTGWLSASLNQTTAPATVTLTATTGSLAAGTYTATVPVTSTATGITNSPQNISVTFTVTSATPVIVLTPTSRTFAATTGGANPATQTVDVSNGGGQTLNGLAVGTITYGSGQTTGWLSASINQTTAPATVTLTATTGSLAAGTYTATVPVTSTASGVTNSPQNISVTFNVAAPGPTITLTPSSRTFSATAGGASPSSQTVQVTNSGGGTLNNLALGTTTYGSGQPTGWLTASINQATAPAVVTLAPATGSLPAGTYTATVPVTSTATGITNSPQNITVTFVVNASGPTISVTNANPSFTVVHGSGNPAARFDTVRNSGTGSLTGLAIGTITYGSGGSGWLSASLAATTAPAQLTLTPTTGSLAPGTYTATVPITSSATGVTNSPRNVTVTFNVLNSNPTISLFPTNRSFSAAVGGSNPSAMTVSVSNSSGGTLSGLATGTITYGSGQPTGWLSASISSTTAPATVTLTPTTGSLQKGTYTATVPVTSSASGVTNSPQNISVTFTVSETDPCALISGFSPGSTYNGALTDGDCNGPSAPVDRFGFTTSSQAFFSATLSTTAFPPLQVARVWTPSTLGLSDGSPSPGGVTLYYLLAAGTYRMDVQRFSTASTGTGSYSLSSLVNPTVPAGVCAEVLTTLNVSATQRLDTSCSDFHNSGSDNPNQPTSVVYYYIWQEAGKQLTIRMNSTAFDAYLEAYNFSAGGFLGANNNGGGGTNALLTIAAPSTGRFVQILAGHFSSGTLLSGNYTFIIDP